MESWVGTPVIKVVTGIRRCGKSTLLRQLADKVERTSGQKIILINFESLEWEHLKEYHALHHHIKTESAGRPALVCIDEVQECPEWERAVNSLLAEGGFDIWISGSNAHLLSSELATLLSGRYVTLHLHPLSFAEHLQFRGVPEQEANEEFSHYLRLGGFPAIHAIPAEHQAEYYQALYNTILLRDIVERHQIRDVALLDRIIRFTMDAVGSFISARRISEFLKSQRIDIAPKTVQQYLAHLESCFALIRVPRYDIKGKRYMEINDKYYLGDIGLRHGLIGHKNQDISGYLENLVAIELLRRGYSLGVGRMGDKEIDFVAERGNERLYIQVCYLLASQETIDREYGALEQVPDHYPKMVLSLDPLPHPGRNGILWRSLPQFLLGESEGHATRRNPCSSRPHFR
jgi:predicted AAA+ superfamily ATPase